MSAYHQHYQDGKRAEPGFKAALVASLLIHLLALGGMVFASLTRENRPEPMQAMKVRLGGPANLKLSGKSRKAPVAGVTKKKKPRPKQKAPPKKKLNPPKKNAKDVGLKREKTVKPKTVDPVVESSTADTGTDSGLSPDPVEKDGPKAIGGLDGDKGVGVAVEVGDGSKAVDTKDIAFISYFRNLQAEIASRWIKTGLGGGTARIRFQIHRDGSISDVTVAQSSGRAYLDGPAKRAVMGADLPPLPQGYLGDKLIVNINFQYGK